MKDFFNIPVTLNQFDTYSDYMAFAQSLFPLTEQEYKGLYNVLLKLQGIGENPVDLMLAWKNSADETESVEFIRFMILVNNTDIEELKKAA